MSLTSAETFRLQLTSAAKPYNGRCAIKSLFFLNELNMWVDFIIVNRREGSPP